MTLFLSLGHCVLLGRAAAPSPHLLLEHESKTANITGHYGTRDSLCENPSGMAQHHANEVGVIRRTDLLLPGVWYFKESVHGMHFNFSPLLVVSSAGLQQRRLPGSATKTLKRHTIFK